MIKISVLKFEAVEYEILIEQNTTMPAILKAEYTIYQNPNSKRALICSLCFREHCGKLLLYRLYLQWKACFGYNNMETMACVVNHWLNFGNPAAFANSILN